MIDRIRTCFHSWHDTLLSLLLLLICSAGCTPTKSLDAYLTFTPTRGPFAIAVNAEGVLEAKNANILITPNIQYRQPEVLFLAPEGQAVKKGDAVVRFDEALLQSEYQTALNALGLARAEAAQQEAEMAGKRGLIEAGMKTSEASAEIAQLQVVRLAFVAPLAREIQKLKVTRAELLAGKNRRQLASLDDIQREERARQQLKVQQAENKVKQVEDFLKRLVLTAPVDGIVIHEINNRSGRKVQVGDALYATMPVVKIPDLSAMRVRLQVGEIDAQRLKPGQKAVVAISSLGDVRVPGRVGRVDRVARPIPGTTRVKQVEVFVDLDSTRADLTPGLTANVRLVVEEFPDAVVVPLECLFQRDSLSVVYVRERTGFVPHRVTVTRQGPDFAVLDCDLKGGERLPLREPDPALVRKNERKP